MKKNSVVAQKNYLLGNFIKEERIKRGLTLHDLGKLTGISPAYLNRIEKGSRKNPSAMVINTLSNFFGVTPEFILSLIGMESSNSIYLDLILQKENIVYFENHELTKQQKDMIFNFVKALLKTI